MGARCALQWYVLRVLNAFSMAFLHAFFSFLPIIFAEGRCYRRHIEFPAQSQGAVSHRWPESSELQHPSLQVCLIWGTGVLCSSLGVLLIHTGAAAPCEP